MANNDFDIDQAKAILWIGKVQTVCSKVDREVAAAKTLCNMEGVGTGQEGDDFFIDVMQKTASLIETTWEACTKVCKEGWELLGDGIGLVSKAGDEIGEVFENLKNKF